LLHRHIGTILHVHPATLRQDGTLLRYSSEDSTSEDQIKTQTALRMAHLGYRNQRE